MIFCKISFFNYLDNGMDTTHICLCFDSNIIQPALLTAFSAANAARGRIVAHLVCQEAVVPKLRHELDILATRLGGWRPEFFTPEIHVVPEDILDAVPIHQWPKAACLRFFIASVLPKEIKRVIYLDCDIFVAADLGELYRVDMRGHPVAAARDTWMHAWFCAGLGLDVRRYFNSGVMLVDLAQWDTPAMRALGLIAENAAAYSCFDQDALNLVFKDNWLALETRWNTMTKQQPYASLWYEFAWPDGRKNERIPSAVYHFTPVKPWDSHCSSRVRFAYRKLARELFEGGFPVKDNASFLAKAPAWLPLPLHRLAFRLGYAIRTLRHKAGQSWKPPR